MWHTFCRESNVRKVCFFSEAVNDWGIMILLAIVVCIVMLASTWCYLRAKNYGQVDVINRGQDLDVALQPNDLAVSIFEEPF